MMKRAVLQVTLVTLFALSTFAGDSTVLHVPAGKTVMLDGRIETAEWADAGKSTFDGNDVLYLKRDTEYLYVAIKPVTPQLYGIDLYFDDGRETLLNLHASASLGERRGLGDSWPDWKWWNHEGWTANVGRVVSWEPRKFSRDDAKEFQIRLSRFQKTTVGLSLDVATGKDGQMLPEKGTERHGRKWITLDLAR